MQISQTILLADKLLLATVFFVSGAGKLADRENQANFLLDFGVPRGLSGSAGILLVFLEFFAAVALLAGGLLGWYGAITAFLLLLVFIVAISAVLLRGGKADCRCFGQLHSAPVGWRTLVRNGLLAACAAWLIVGGRAGASPSVLQWILSLGSRDRRAAIVIVSAAALFFFRSLARYQTGSSPLESVPVRHADHPKEPATDDLGLGVAEQVPAESPHPKGVGLPQGTPAPEFELPDVTGVRHSLRSILANGTPLVLLFTNPHCESCHALLHSIANRTQREKEQLPVVLISGGTAEENLAKLNGFGLTPILLEQNFEISGAYDCTVVPSAVLIGASGLIQSGLAVGKEAIQQLINTVKQARLL